MPTKDSHYFLIVLLVTFLILFILTILGLLAPIVLGFLLAGGAYPIYKKLSPLIGSTTAALITVFLIALIIILPFAGLLTLIVSETLDLVTNWNDSLISQYLVQWTSSLGEFAGFTIDAGVALNEQLAPALQDIGIAVSREVGGFLSNAIKLGLNFFVMMVTTFYMLRDGKAFGKFLMNLSPLKSHDELLLYKTFKQTGQAVFYSNFITGLVQGILGGLGFFFAGLAAPVLWGTMIGFLSFIPLLGGWLIFLPAALYLFVTGNTGIAFAFLAYNFLIVSSVDNVLRPYLIGGKIKIHPLLVLLSILGGINLFGIIGIIYGPLIFAIFLALLNVYEETNKLTHTHT